MLGVPLGPGHTPLVDFGYNRLWTDDAAVLAFLEAKDPDWAATQDVDTAAVTPSAGTTLDLVDASGAEILVQVPTGAVTATTTLVLAPLAEPADTPSGMLFAGQSFTLGAYRDSVLLEGFAFDTPVTITLTYTDDWIAGVDESTLALYVREGTGWVDVANTCEPPSTYRREPALNRLTVDICHLSEYALFGVQTDPYPFKVFLPLVKR
jgi:hypothetical protein